MRIIIADDHPLYREAVGLRLQRLFPRAVVVEVGDVDAVLRGGQRADETPALILLDLKMPGMEGGKGVLRVREAHPDASVVVMSGNAGPDDVKLVISHGARGFLPKTMAPEAFEPAISLLVAGGTYVPAEALGEVMSPPPEPEGVVGSRRDLERMLTPREQQVLIGLATGASNKELGRQFGLTEVTVKGHVRQILKKIGARNRAGAAAAVVRAGLM